MMVILFDADMADLAVIASPRYLIHAFKAHLADHFLIRMSYCILLLTRL